MANELSEKQKQFNAEFIEVDNKLDAAREIFRKALNEYEKACHEAYTDFRRMEYVATNDDELNRISLSIVSNHTTQMELVLKKFNGVRCEMV